MKLKEILREKRVYFDSSIFVFLLGSFEDQELLNDLKSLILKRDIKVFTCDLVYTQVIPIFAPNGEPDLKDNVIDFVDTFNPSGINSRKSNKVYQEVSRMSQMRSIHVLSAIENECDIFLTDDPEIQVPDCLKLVLFSDYKNNLIKDLAV